MTESESVALPLGDTPIWMTGNIIAESAGFVKNFFKFLPLSDKFFQRGGENEVFPGAFHTIPISVCPDFLRFMCFFRRRDSYILL